MTTATRARMRRSTAFLPNQLSGLAVWLAADQIRGLADTADITSWLDTSGNGRNAVEWGDATTNPTYRTSVVASRPVARFNGTIHRLQSATFTLTQPTTVLAVAKATVLSGTTFIFDGIGGNRQAIFTNATAWQMYAGTVQTGGTADTSWHVFTALFNGASSTLRVDGTGVIAADVGAASLGGVTLGSAGDAAGAIWNGDIAEVVVYNRAVTAPERTSLEGYLGAKYGITVV